MTRNQLSRAAAGIAAILTLSACMVPPPRGGGSMSMSNRDGSSSYQRWAPHGADPDAHFHRLASTGMEDR